MQRLRGLKAAPGDERVLTRSSVRAHGTLMQPQAMPTLLRAPGVGTVLGVDMLALAAAMRTGRGESSLPQTGQMLFAWVRGGEWILGRV